MHVTDAPASDFATIWVAAFTRQLEAHPMFPASLSGTVQFESSADDEAVFVRIENGRAEVHPGSTDRDALDTLVRVDAMQLARALSGEAPEKGLYRVWGDADLYRALFSTLNQGPRDFLNIRNRD